ncbi:MAG: hypothetical protein LC104_21740 [Bacteroidales bacterium]|nr:hypothetical protein [Bacteroidales bacterium]
MVSIAFHAVAIGVIGWTWEHEPIPPAPQAKDPFHLILHTSGETEWESATEPPLQLTLTETAPPAELVAKTDPAPVVMPTTLPTPPPLAVPQPVAPSAEPPMPTTVAEGAAPSAEPESPVLRPHRPIPPVIPESWQERVRALAEKPQPVAVVQDVVDLTPVAAVVETVETVKIAEAREAAQSAKPPLAVPVAKPGVVSVRPTPPSGRGMASGVTAAPIHGALPPQSAIVYVLDCSGTMGLDGKLDRARDALRATLAAQSSDIVVHIVTYQGQARVLDAGRWQAQLRELEPSGSSQHAAGIRAALKWKPHFIVLFTDAQDEELAELRPLLRGAGRTVSLSVVRVERNRIREPQLLQ